MQPFRVTGGGVYAADAAPVETAGLWVEEIEMVDDREHPTWRFAGVE